MAKEARVQCSLSIRKMDATGTIVLLEYAGRPSAFQADVSGAFGPTPGSLIVPLAGIAVDLSNLDRPGLCRIMNQDDENFVMVGMRDPDSTLFYPLMEVLPGETYVIRLSRDIQQEYQGTGTGTGVAANQLWLKPDTAPCNVLVEAFEA